MTTRQIYHERWQSFFNRFSKEHEGWPTTVHLLDAERGERPEATALPLIGISYEPRGSERGSIELMLGGVEGNFMRIIPSPERVWLRESADAADTALEIEGMHGPKTLIRFGSPGLPQLAEPEELPEAAVAISHVSMR
jgi:hypothetical protein